MANAYRSVLKDAVNPTGNALPADVLFGKTFSNADGIDKTGTMVNNGAVTITLTAQDPSYTVPEGYHNGSGTVSFTPSGGDGADLVVTCSEDFAGATISCTDGTTTYTEICPSTSPYIVTFESIPTGTWTISGFAVGQTFSTTVTILDFTAELNSIPEGSTATPTDDIQIWLHCASIWDKNYTTISQVLADASTLQALIASNNAADYMARSTTWASDVTADSSAMSYIGLNDYCADALLEDSTWLNAICNSTYFESILNVKVPNMTSATTPSGEVTASSYYTASNNYPYYAFSDNAYAWKPQTGESNSWICYEFTEPVCVKKINFVVGKSGTFTDPVIIFQGSNDGNTWTDITTNITLTSATTQNIASSNATKFKKYRLYTAENKLLPTASQYYQFTKIQYYGRA